MFHRGLCYFVYFFFQIKSKRFYMNATTNHEKHRSKNISQHICIFNVALSDLTAIYQCVIREYLLRHFK